MAKPLEPGMMVGAYKVLSLLGKGGMGEVLLAEDTRLDRKVALKILPPHLVHDPERLRRFTQEARAASALNHPNILTIYEVGESDGAPFIATEFIEGETLRSRINAGNLTVREALDIAIQAAGALAAAHEAGIVHRDIKPENIMVRADGYIKILDFGLAKLTDRAPSGPNDTQAMTMTTPGMVMGTAQYMSPEQARGLPLDARSDLFSLGIVLYEMVARRAPFEGETPSHVIVAILEKPVIPVTVAAPEAPAQLEPVLEKALAKDREDRYQTAKDLAVDLRTIRRRIEFDTELRRTTPSAGFPAVRETSANTIITPPVSAGWTSTGSPRPPAAATAVSTGPHPAPGQQTPSSPPVSGGTVPPAGVAPPPPPVTPNPLAAAPADGKKPKSKRLKRWFFLLAAFALWKSGIFQNKPKPSNSHSAERLKFSRVTTSGSSFTAAVSPDGRYIAYAQVESNGELSMWMRQTATNTNLQVVPPMLAGYAGLTFSPDGNFLYFARRDPGKPMALYRVPVLGGTPVLLISPAGSPTLSPDGKEVAFLRAGDEPNSQEIVIADSDGGNPRHFASPEKGEILRAIAWSPDGEWIAATALSGEESMNRGILTAFRVKNGERKQLARQKWSMVGELAWTSSDGDLVLLANDHPDTGGMQIWHVDTDTKDAKRLSNDLNGFGSLGASMNTDQLIAIQAVANANLWIRPTDGSVQDEQITTGGARADGALGLAWSPDDRIVFQSKAGGADDIWISKPDGTESKQLTHSGLSTSPVVSPDGKTIYYTSARTGIPQVWRMDIDGRDEKQITRGKGADNPSVSADGESVLFHSLDVEAPGIYRMSADGHNRERVGKEICAFASYSPDGKSILCAVADPRSGAVPRLEILAPDSGNVERVIEIPPVLSAQYKFAPDSKSITYLYVERGIRNIWAMPVAGGAPRKITQYKSGRIFTYAFSPDGKQIAMSRGDLMADVVLIKNSEE